MNSRSSSPGETTIANEIKHLSSILLANYRLFIFAFILGFFAVLGIASTLPAKYTSSVSIIIDNSKIRAAPAEKDAATGAVADLNQMDTEVEILKSTSLEEIVAKNLRLDQDPEFNPQIAKPKPRFSFFGIGLGASSKAQAPMSPRLVWQQVLANLSGTATIRRQGQTRVVVISIETGSPASAAQIADAWADAYISLQVQTRTAALEDANGQLGERLEALRRQASDAQAKVEQYNIAHNLTNTPQTSLPVEEMGFLQNELATVNAQVAESKARLAAAQQSSGPGGQTGQDALQSDALRDLRTQYATVAAKLASLETRYGPMHPDVVNASNEEASIAQQIHNETARLLEDLKTEDAVARQKQKVLQNAMANSRGTLNLNMSANIELNNLQLNAAATNAIYQSYLDHYKEVTSQLGIENSSARVLSKATVPTGKTSPKMSVAALLGIVAGSGFGLIAVGTKSWFRVGIATGKQVTSLLETHYLGAIAELNSTLDGKTSEKPWAYIQAHPFSVFAEQHRMLLSAIRASKASVEKGVIAITSSIPREGKTTTSLCLATTAALTGQSVLVIDCDLRRRSLSQTLGGNFKTGLVEVLSGRALLQEALYDGSGVTYLPLSDSPMSAKNVFGSNAMVQLLSKLRPRFELIILDTPPILPIVDSRTIAHLADIVAVLGRAERTPAGAMNNALDILWDEGITHVAGVALTMVDLKREAANPGVNGNYHMLYKDYYFQ